MILLLDRLFQMNLSEATKAKNHYNKFLQTNEEIKKIINMHQFIEGFQISTKEFYLIDPRTKVTIDDYITILESSPEEAQEEILEIKENDEDSVKNFEEKMEIFKEERVKTKETIKDSLETTANDANTDEFSSEFSFVEGKNFQMKTQLKKAISANSAIGNGFRKSMILQQIFNKKEEKDINFLNTKKPILSVNKSSCSTGDISAKKRINLMMDRVKEEEMSNSPDLIMRYEINYKKTPKKLCQDFEEDFDLNIFKSFFNNYSKK